LSELHSLIVSIFTDLHNPRSIFTNLHEPTFTMPSDPIPTVSGSGLGTIRQQPECFLLKMPAEIMMKICIEIMSDRQAANSLPRLARTCRAINQAAVVVLYSHIRDLVRWRLPALHLQRTLYTNQHLNTLVKSFAFVVKRVEAVHAVKGDFRDFPEYSTALSELFGLDPAEASSVQEPINTMMLVRLTPNLKQLCLNADPRWRNTDFLLAYKNKRVTGPRCTFSSLRGLHIFYRRRAGTSLNTGLNLQKLNGLLRSTPYLTELMIDAPRGGTSLTCRLPNLTTLILTKVLLCSRGLQHLLRGCNNLATVIISHQCDATVSARFSPITVPEILACLAPSRFSLRSLHLTPWVPPSNDPRDGAYGLLPGRLGDFPALRQLALDYRALGRQFHDSDVLVELLSGLDNLEGILLYVAHTMTVEAFSALADEIVGPALAWPRLRRIWLTPGTHDLPDRRAHFEGELRRTLGDPEVHPKVGRLQARGVTLFLGWMYGSCGAALPLFADGSGHITPTHYQLSR
jgi:hypothetical protein